MRIVSLFDFPVRDSPMFKTTATRLHVKEAKLLNRMFVCRQSQLSNDIAGHSSYSELPCPETIQYSKFCQHTFASAFLDDVLAFVLEYNMLILLQMISTNLFPLTVLWRYLIAQKNQKQGDSKFKKERSLKARCFISFYWSTIWCSTWRSFH